MSKSLRQQKIEDLQSGKIDKLTAQDLYLQYHDVFDDISLDNYYQYLIKPLVSSKIQNIQKISRLVVNGDDVYYNYLNYTKEKNLQGPATTLHNLKKFITFMNNHLDELPFINSFDIDVEYQDEGDDKEYVIQINRFIENIYQTWRENVEKKGNNIQ